MTQPSAPNVSRLEPEPVPRRDFLGLSALAAAAAASLFAVIGMLRLPRAAVLSSPAKKFRVTLPESLAAGQAFVPPGRAGRAVPGRGRSVRDLHGLHAPGMYRQERCRGFRMPVSRFAIRAGRHRHERTCAAPAALAEGDRQRGRLRRR